MFNSFLKIAIRNLQKRPFYSFINILGLSIGMACTLLIAVYITHELSYDRFHDKADRIYRLGSDLEVGSGGFKGAAVASGVAQVLEAEVPAVEMAVRIDQSDDRLFQRGDIIIKEDKVLSADPEFFRMFSFQLLEGNPATALAEPRSIVMTEEVARKYVPEGKLIGQSLQMDGVLYQITGLMRPVPEASHMQFKIVYSFLSNPKHQQEGWGDLNTATYFLLHKNATIEEVNAQLTPLLAKYFEEYELFQQLGYKVEMFTQALTDIHLHSHLLGEFEPNANAKHLYIFGAIATFILLLACINFMNLATARSAERAKEVGVRKSMGSARSLLIRQFLGESLLLSIISVILAIALAELLSLPFSQLAAKELQLPIQSFWFVPSVLLLGIVAGVIAGSYPAFYLTRFRPAEVLRGRLAIGNKNIWLRNTLVVFQFVVSIVLIVCTLGVFEQLQFIRNKDLGFDRENIIILKGGKALSASREGFYNALMQQAEVKSLSFSDSSPLEQHDGSVFIPSVQDDSERGFTFRDEDAQVLQYMQVSYDYISTMGIRLKEGRNFSREATSDSMNYALIINEAAARQLGLKEPVGSIVMAASEFEAEVVGVTEDYHYESLHHKVQPFVLLLSDAQNYVEVKVQSENLTHTLSMLEEQWDLHSDGTPFDYSFLNEDFEALFRADQQVGKIFGAFTSLAIFIACIGLLALASFMAEQRTKEIGIRKVLGASVKSIILLLSKDFTRLIMLAFVLAVPLAYWAMRTWLNDFAYRIHIGISSFIVAGSLALLIALLTVSYQSFKAAVVNPVKSLRNE